MWPGNDLPENEREITLRDTLGGQDLPESAHQLDIKNAVDVRFPERTKGRTAAGPRNPSRSQHTGSKRANAPPRCPPTRMKMRALEPLSFPGSSSRAVGLDPTELVLQLGGHIASISCSIKGVS